MSGFADLSAPIRAIFALWALLLCLGNIGCGILAAIRKRRRFIVLSILLFAPIYFLWQVIFDQFVYDDWYGKLKNESTGVGILLDPMLGATNFDELKASYEENNSDEDEYSLVETTVNGYKALILKYSDWLGATMRVDIDFGGNHDGWYGLSFAVSGDTLSDCDTELIWAIIESMELA